jgi:hypothetical protein
MCGLWKDEQLVRELGEAVAAAIDQIVDWMLPVPSTLH